MSSTGWASPSNGSSATALPFQCRWKEPFTGLRRSGSPANQQSFAAEAAGRVHRLVGARAKRERGVRADDFDRSSSFSGVGAGSAKWHRVLSVQRRAVVFRVSRLTGAAVGDRPELVGPGPRDAPVGGSAHGRELFPRRRRCMPTRLLRCVLPVAGGDQQAAVGRPELDVADVPSPIGVEDGGTPGLGGGGGGCSRRQVAPSRPSLASAPAGRATATSISAREHRQGEPECDARSSSLLGSLLAV